MGQMNKETKNNLQRIADAVWNEMGEESLFAAYPKAIYRKAANKLGIKISYATIQKWEKWISSLLKFKRENDLLIKKEVVEEVIEVIPTPERVLITIVKLYSDGTFDLEYPDQIKEVEEVEEYHGLFDYSGGRTIIQRGKYKGCDIKIPTDIYKYFGNSKMFEGWAYYQISAAQSPDFKGVNKDTNRDIETLKSALKSIKKLYELEKSWK
jgi:hypothetical protein